MLHRSLAVSAGYFRQPAEFENVANTDFKNLKHFQNPGHLSLTAPSMLPKIHHPDKPKSGRHAVIPLQGMLSHTI